MLGTHPEIPTSPTLVLHCFLSRSEQEFLTAGVMTMPAVALDYSKYFGSSYGMTDVSGIV